MNSKALAHCAHGDFSNILEYLWLFKNKETEQAYYITQIERSLQKGTELINQMKREYENEKALSTISNESGKE